MAGDATGRPEAAKTGTCDSRRVAKLVLVSALRLASHEGGASWKCSEAGIWKGLCLFSSERTSVELSLEKDGPTLRDLKLHTF